MHVTRLSRFLPLAAAVALTIGVAVQSPQAQSSPGLIVGEPVASGVRITPTAAPGAVFDKLNPEVAPNSSIRANQAVTTAISPDGRTLLVLTSGYNSTNASSDEFVFVYSISPQDGTLTKTQVIHVPNTFMGLAWSPSGSEFYVAGGINDNVHVYRLQGALWTEVGPPIALGHTSGVGLDTTGFPSMSWLEVAPLAAGLGVSANGARLLAANLENDSVSLVNLQQRTVVGELDLRPGKNAPDKVGVPGGEFPTWVAIKGNHKAYVSSLRDREVVVLDLTSDQLSITQRIKVSGNPGRMIFDRTQGRLFVALDNSDSVAIIDTSRDRVKETIDVNTPFGTSTRNARFTGSHPNSLALSPDEQVLYVTLGGTNALAVVLLEGREEEEGDEDENEQRPIGLIPTGWYPNSVSVSPNGRRLYVVNAIGQAGPIIPGANPNSYVLQLRHAGLLSLPLPSPRELAHLTKQTLFNNGALGSEDRRADAMMDFLRKNIKHVIYVVKENRTYDQVLGDLGRGNSDPTLTMFPRDVSPNHHKLAEQFVTLDNWYCSGSVSGDGWVWSTAGRASDYSEKIIAVNYAGRGLSYDFEGTTRNINTSQPTVAERQAVNRFVPDDPDLLPGTADVAALDGPGGEKGRGYVWDSARRAGLTVRNYGFFGDFNLNYFPEGHGYPPLLANPRAAGVRVFYPAHVGLSDVSDPYYREYDMDYPDWWRFKEWEYEFDQFARAGALPNLSLVELPHDHFGNFGGVEGDYGVNTPFQQMGDNDYALARIVDKVAKSKFAHNTLIFVVEDDAQDGPDHVDSQRSIAYVVGPYVKQGAVVSTHYGNPNMLRTIADILGMEPMGLQVALAEPMWEVFDRSQAKWEYTPILPAALCATGLAKEVGCTTTTVADGLASSRVVERHSAAWWVEKMKGLDFKREDNLDTDRFNRVLWEGIMGPDKPYPTERHGRNLSANR